ncbi:MAG: metallophosphoesterase [Candidatus Omnitrophota bacterium]|nr:metallophosphoesterase [Candidatus Omnitrophota bacterium]
MRKILLAFIFLSLFIFSSQPCSAEPRKLTIIFTGDTRGELENCHCPKNDFGGFQRRFNYIDDARKDADEILLLDVGDVLPLLNSSFTRKNITYAAFISFKSMQYIGYDAMNAGESDLVLGEAFLKNKSKNLEFPIISSNIVSKSGYLPFFKPYAIKTMNNGLKVGIIGVTNERYVINSERLEVAANREAVKKYVNQIRDQVDVVIALGHIGLPYSIELAEKVEGIDVILSGHWDSETQEPQRVGKTIVMPTVSYSRSVGRLDMEIEGEGVISSYEWQSVQLDAKYDGDDLIKRLVSKMPSENNMESRGSAGAERKSAVEKPRPVLIDTASRPEPDRPLRVFVFYAAGCRSCAVIKRDVLPGIEEKYGNKISIERYDIGISRNYAQMVRLEKLYGAEGGYVPEVIVSKYVLMGEEKIRSSLDKTIEKALLEPRREETAKLTELDAAGYQVPDAQSLILSRFESFSAFTVGAAGFLDGINPCAFTTIAFFISFLAFAGYRKREMIMAGSFFTLAVFLAYFLIGLGIFRFLRSISAFSYLTLAINILIGGLAFTLGILSLVDYFRFRKTRDVKTSILQLPKSIKNRIHSVIGGDFRKGGKVKRGALLKIAWIAFTSGFMVSILESICTGQVYLPTIAYVLRMPAKHTPALSYLVLYNLAFITPLVIVFILGLFGATSGAFAKFMQKHFGFVKLSTATLFFILAATLVLVR